MNRKKIFQKPKKYDDNGLLYHDYKFSFMKNVNAFICRIVGHRLAKKPSHNVCGRCGLCYEEIYHDVGKGWFIESGIVKENVLELPIQQEESCHKN